MSVLPDLATLWAFIIVFAIVAYVVLDGFDLGIGILFPLLAERRHREVAMNAIAPVWDGNETWLVLGGGGLMAAFPLAYAVLLPAIYVPIVVMLLGLVFRGVAFEFRWRTERGRGFWDLAFAAGSLAAALAQGVALGAILQGVAVEHRAYAGGWWDWLSPFSLLTGAAVAVGYALLGAGWLIFKTQDDLQARAYRLAWWCAVGTLGAMLAVSLATPFLQGGYWQRWFDWPAIVVTAPVPIAVAVVAWLLARSLAAKRELQPFLLSLALFGLTFVGLGISLWPYIVPERITIWDAAAPESSQLFMLVGVGILLPLILAYTAWAYWVFRGKVDPHHGYH